MGAKSRNKGAGFEREVVATLREMGYAAKRAWHLAEVSGHDIVIEGFAVECKRYARIGIYDWWAQAVIQSVRHGEDRLRPLLVMRADRKPDTLVAMRLQDWCVMAEKAGYLTRAEVSETIARHAIQDQLTNQADG
jgi:Holliday junction resolvase